MRSITPTPGPFSLANSAILVALLGPEHLLDGILERAHPRLDRRTPFERPDRIVLQERRGRPEADERRRPDVAAAAGRQRIVVLGARDRMADLDRADRRQLSCTTADEKLSQMLPRMALVASGLQALMPSSVTGTRSSLER